VPSKVALERPFPDGVRLDPSGQWLRVLREEGVGRDADPDLVGGCEACGEEGAVARMEVIEGSAEDRHGGASSRHAGGSDPKDEEEEHDEHHESVEHVHRLPP
jgi:hypothetical protein